VIYDTYGDKVNVKPKQLLKFGRTNNADNGTKTTIMTLPSSVAMETYPTTNAITTISSTVAGDTENIKVEGHTISGNDLTFVVQSATLSGTSQVTLTTPLARCTRIYNNDSTELAGTVYAYEDDTSSGGVPDTAAGVHCMIDGGQQQSQKAATSISQSDYWLIHSITASVLRGNSATVAADIFLEVKLAGGVFRQLDEFTVKSGPAFTEVYRPLIIIPTNADVRLTCISNTNDSEITGSINGLLALKR
jgi:hypothetical protein